MASQGPLSPSTGADDSSVGTITWTNPGNILASDNARATAVFTGAAATSHYLKATGFGFSIPSGATINGILVEIERSVSNVNSTFKDSRVRLIKGGTIQTTDKATATAWPVSSADAYASYGGSADLWSGSWTDTDINASNFGVALAVQKTASGKTGGTAQVDHMRITVTYTTATGHKNTQCVSIG